MKIEGDRQRNHAKFSTILSVYLAASPYHSTWVCVPLIRSGWGLQHSSWKNLTVPYKHVGFDCGEIDYLALFFPFPHSIRVVCGSCDVSIKRGHIEPIKNA